MDDIDNTFTQLNCDRQSDRKEKSSDIRNWKRPWIVAGSKVEISQTTALLLWTDKSE